MFGSTPIWIAPTKNGGLRALLTVCLLLSLVVPLPGVSTGQRSGQAAIELPSGRESATRARIGEAYGALPLQFEANGGQAHPEVRFVSRGAGYTFFLTRTGAVLSLDKVVGARAGARDAAAGVKREDRAPSVEAVQLRMELLGAARQPRITGLDPMPGKLNYFIGSDPSRWRTDVPAYGKVRYEGVYPGVDMVYYGNQRELEYDFVLAPGAEPSSIAFRIEGAERMGVAANGDLVLRTRAGEVRQRRPYAYQEVGGAKREVPSRYVVDGNRVSFAVGGYDRGRQLVIDPVLVYSTYLGGSRSDGATTLAVDAAGNAYVVGSTTSRDFAATVGALDRSYNGYLRDVFVAKLNSAGTRLLYSTYIGGRSGDRDGENTVNGDYATDIAIDGSGNAYLTGETDSRNFPTTPGAYDRTFNGVSFYGGDAFVAKLNPTGSRLLYSTFLGGRDGEGAYSIALDAARNAYITGYSESANFPTRNAFQRSRRGDQDAFVTKLNARGSGLIYSTYVGGGGAPQFEYGLEIAVDADRYAYVTGTTDARNFPTTPGAFDRTRNATALDAFVLKLNRSGNGLVFSTYLGGASDDNEGQQGLALAVDTARSVYVGGVTDSRRFPTTRGAYDRSYNGGRSDAFLTKINPTGSRLVYSTYLGGSGRQGYYEEAINSIALDTSGSAFVTGGTDSSDFPTTAGAFDRTYNGRDSRAGDAFVAKLDARGSRLLYSTYLGGTRGDQGNGIALGPARDAQQSSSGVVYIAGFTTSPDIPTTPGALDRTYSGSGGAWSDNAGDAFVVKMRTR